MTQELQEHLNREMEDALAITDEDRRKEAIRTVLIHQNNALLDCQRKTAERVKAITADVPAIKADVAAIKSIIEQGKRKFAAVALSAIKWIVLGGGGAEFIRYIVSH